ncbi:sigma 54-interacting transcriptional regulator [Tautonia rosea]|uniref:sigma 54-interacting transcriptional regulator n=1 Tax=Tautonia rosea TaxID=2728037 RepID=UPI0014752826|nr:sigma 54-interacting transcriptional regulator [Tautonia rosea]
MPWIPHVMILDDDPRVLESLVPGFVQELGRSLSQSREIAGLLRRGAAPDDARGPVRIKVSAHGFESNRVASFRYRSPFEVHLHLVRERGGSFEVARRLLNQQTFAAVVSDQRFSDDAGGQRAGQYFVAEAARVHPEVQGLLYSAYPRPDDFPSDRFIRKGAGGSGGADDLAEQVVRAVERHQAVPAVRAFAQEIGDRGLISQSESFGAVIAQLFDLAQLIGSADVPSGSRMRRPLPCLLIDGESGTGKRGLAELFHAASDRRSAPLVVASCSELTNETLLRSILFGHKRGAFTDAREDRPGLVSAAGKGVLLLDDVHRLPPACSAILHSFLEDGEYGRLGEEEIRRRAECAVVLTVETGPWRERRQSGELPVAFLARVERLLVAVPPLRDRPEDIEAQARWLTRTLSAELGVDLELADDAVARLKTLRFEESNSRELRNVLERAIYRHYREADQLEWAQIEPFASAGERTVRSSLVSQASTSSPRPPSTATQNDWQRRLRALAAKILAKGTDLDADEARQVADSLFDERFPGAWEAVQQSRDWQEGQPPLPLPLWEDLWRCFSVSWLGGPSPAEKDLGIPANTLRQWINDRESR